MREIVNIRKFNGDWCFLGTDGPIIEAHLFLHDSESLVVFCFSLIQYIHNNLKIARLVLSF